MKIVVYNLGCKVNQYECDSLVKSLRENGNIVSENLEVADIYIVNTCAVTNEAERKSRQFVGKCHKLNPDAKIFIVGCASQNNQKQFEDKDGVVAVLGTANKMSLSQSLACSGNCVSPISNAYEDNFCPTLDRTRAYVKIQDGCNNFCSYCLIPYLRGRSRSRSLESVYAECLDISRQTKEIVLTGIDMSSYGKDADSSLTELVTTLAYIDCRVRLGSLEVNVIDEQFLIATTKLKNFCPQFHLSLQSGSDNVLRKMNRHYTTDEYLAKAQLIRKYYPLAGITTDLICGFPTETDKDFEDCLNFVKKVEFLQMHIFGYSKRGGTVAEKYQQLDKSIVNKRVDMAEIVAAECRDKALSKYMSGTLNVLIESQTDNVWTGYSKEYVKVVVKNAAPNCVVAVKPKQICNGEIVGEIL